MTEGEAEAVFRFFGGVHGDGVMGELSGLVGKRQADEKGERDDQRHYHPAGGADDKCCQGAGFWCGVIGHGLLLSVGTEVPCSERMVIVYCEDTASTGQ